MYKKDRKRKKRAVGANKNKNYCFDPRDPCIQTTPERESQLLDLEPYKEYHVKIAAFNSGGDGPFSEELVFRTAEAEPGVPYAVNIYAYGRYAKLTWKQPRQSNGKILQYEVSGRGVVKILLPWWMRRHIIYDLEYNSTYEAQLRARTSTGWGKPVIRWFKTALPQSKLCYKDIFFSVLIFRWVCLFGFSFASVSAFASFFR